MKKKVVLVIMTILLLMMVNTPMVSQTVVSEDDFPTVKATEIKCTSKPIKPNNYEWFKVRLSNEEYENVTVDVWWYLDGGFRNETLNITVPPRTTQWTDPVLIEWPDNYWFHIVKVEIWWQGTKIHTKFALFRARIFVSYVFNSRDTSDPVEEWSVDPSYMVDGNGGSFALTQSDNDVELLIGNTCPGTELGNITGVELRTRGYYYVLYNDADIILRPVFPGGDGDNHVFDALSTPEWSGWIDITNDTNAPSPWTWTDVVNLDCDVEADSSGIFMLFCSKIEIRVAYD